MPFEFQPDTQVKAAQYESVKLFAEVPKNPEDFHSMQDILRHRQTMLVNDLYGDCRVKLTETDIKTELKDGKYYTTVKALYYLDGYRVYVDAPLFAEITDGTYELQLDLSFEEVRYTADADLALIDQVTQKYIPTSSRFKFKKDIKLQRSNTTNVIPEGVVRYVLGTIVFANNSLNFTDSLIVVNTKYNEAMEIVNTSVHKDAEGDIVNDVFVATAGVKNAEAYVVTAIADEQIQQRYISPSLKHVAGFDYVNMFGDWTPLLWMRSELVDNPQMQLTRDDLAFTDNLGNSSRYSANKVFIGNSNSGADISNKIASFKFNGKEALKAMSYSSATAERFHSPSYVSGNATPETPTSVNYQDAISLIPTKEAVFSSFFSVPFPEDKIFTLNFLSTFVEGIEDEKGVLNIKVDAQYNGEGAYNNILLHKIYLANNQLTNSDPVSFYIDQDLSQVADLDIRVTLTISGSAKIKFEWLKSKGLSWIYAGTSNTAVDVEALRINNGLLWVDSDKKLRVKTTTDATLGADFQRMKANAAGSTPESLGGMLVGGGVRELNDLTSETQTISLTIDDGTSLPVKPVIESSETNGIGNHNITFPLATSSNCEAGLISFADFDAVRNAAMRALNNGSITMAPDYTCYVAKSWGSYVVASPYFTSIRAAVQDLYFKLQGKPTQRGLVVVYPGEYSDSQPLGLIPNVDIIALDPEATTYTTAIADTAGALTSGVHFGLKAKTVSITNATSKLKLHSMDLGSTQGYLHIGNGEIEVLKDVALYADPANSANGAVRSYGGKLKINGNVKSNKIGILNGGGEVTVLGNVECPEDAVKVTGGKTKIFGDVKGSIVGRTGGELLINGKLTQSGRYLMDIEYSVIDILNGFTHSDTNYILDNVSPISIRTNGSVRVKGNCLLKNYSGTWKPDGVDIIANPSISLIYGKLKIHGDLKLENPGGIYVAHQVYGDGVIFTDNLDALFHIQGSIIDSYEPGSIEDHFSNEIINATNGGVAIVEGSTSSVVRRCMHADSKGKIKVIGGYHKSESTDNDMPVIVLFDNTSKAILNGITLISAAAQSLIDSSINGAVVIASRCYSNKPVTFTNKLVETITYDADIIDF